MNRRISDGRVLKDGAWAETEIGSPQGGVISPLPCNIYLDAFDQEMKAQEIRIVRYADDILIFARSARQAERYQAIAMKVLEEDLKLVVNREKTHITSVRRGVAFLGFMIYPTCVSIHPKRVKRFKDRVRQMTHRNSGVSVEQMALSLNPFLRGWISYFRLANCKGLVEDMMGWIRRRLRMKQMREWKGWKALHRELRRRGYQGEFRKISMRRWPNSASPLVSMALPNQWFDEIGLVDLTRYEVGTLHRYYEVA